MNVLAWGQATMVLAAGIKWQACREFAERHANLIYTFAGPAIFLVAAYLGYVETFNSRVMRARITPGNQLLWNVVLTSGRGIVTMSGSQDRKLALVKTSSRTASQREGNCSPT
jgi:hypothetical protein